MDLSEEEKKEFEIDMWYEKLARAFIEIAEDELERERQEEERQKALAAKENEAETD